MSQAGAVGEVPCFQRENRVFPILSTKLSTAFVDKIKKRRVYGHLGELLRFYMSLLLHCMIFLQAARTRRVLPDLYICCDRAVAQSGRKSDYMDFLGTQLCTKIR
jgi:hypothetical protein